MKKKGVANFSCNTFFCMKGIHKNENSRKQPGNEKL